MADTVLPKPDPLAFDTLMRAQAKALRADDKPPADRKTWEQHRSQLIKRMGDALGPLPPKPCDLEPKELGVLKRAGYRVEKLVFQSRPEVWVTANAYVPDPVKEKLPAVLAVHGHWPWARRDPVVQARCLGLVKLGFFVLAVDAFGAGERYTAPARGTYHGALYGSTLWPTGLTLLGQQVYDNRRAVDYLLTRPEVNPEALGVTGASGGGNQTMYAGALDERFKAVVPVCSVGTYQAYLHAACCACEVLPGALRFAEEGDVLALAAPRALLVVNATKDAFQFSVAEAEKSVARARPVFKLYGAEEKLRHATFESPHAYNQPMREAMYGWMTKWLKNEGEGTPIAEPKHEVEKPEELSCYPDGSRPKGFLFPPSLAAREARALLKESQRRPSHPEEWESTATEMRTRLRRQVFGDFPKLPNPSVEMPARKDREGDVATRHVLIHPEPALPLPAVLKAKSDPGPRAACVLLHLDGKAEALKHPLAQALLGKGWAVLAPDLRATGETKPAGDVVRDAPDHNSAEHALWVGRPLLGQWAFDVLCLIDWAQAQEPPLGKKPVAVVGIGQAGVVALCAAGLFEDRVASAAVIDAPVSYVTEVAYGAGTRMGLLAPGILRVGDVPQLAALAAPRRLIIAGGVTPQGQKLGEKPLQEAYAFTQAAYRLYRSEERLSVKGEMKAEELAAGL